MNSSSQMLEKKSLNGNEILVLRRPDDRQVKCQISFDGLCDSKGLAKMLPLSFREGI